MRALLFSRIISLQFSQNRKGFLKRPQKFEIFSNKQVGDFLAFSNCLFSFLVLPIKCLLSNAILEHWTFQEGVKQGACYQHCHFLNYLLILSKRVSCFLACRCSMFKIFFIREQHLPMKKSIQLSTKIKGKGGFFFRKCDEIFSDLQISKKIFYWPYSLNMPR